MKKTVLVMLTLLLCALSLTALAQGIQQPGIQQPGIQQPGIQQPGIQQPAAQPAAPAAPAAPVYLDNGLLAPGAEPVIEKDHAGGHWLYVDESVKVEITRYQTTSPKLTYYIADILCGEGEYMRTYTYNKERPGRTNGRPEDMAKKHNAVYAQSGDFYSYRISHDQTVGIIIRDGEILNKKTYKRLTKPNLPDLSNLALFPDGSMSVHRYNEYTAQDYIDQGATDVLAFGPILIKDGEINADVYTNFKYEEPRNALGVIAPGHYVGMLVEGRMDHSDGCGLKFMAETLKSLGCTDAMNLDGGGTAAMVFMGESVQMGNDGSVRSSERAVPDILAVGTYD